MRSVELLCGICDMTFGLFARTTHARCSTYVRYGVSHTSDKCCVCRYVNCIHASSLQLISSKTTFRWSERIGQFPFAVVDRRVLHSQHTYQSMPKSK